MSTAAPAESPLGWGSPTLQRATFALALTQLVSWGVLFYGFAVVAPAVTADTGWPESVVAGAFSVGLLVAGLSAPVVARTLGRRDPRVVLTAGSVVGAVGMVLFASAHHVVVLYLAWVIVGFGMAATLYEPAMAVLVALDPARRRRTLTIVTVAGGLASTVFAPLGGLLVDEMGWRQALVVMAISGGAATAALHALALPRARSVAAPPQPAPAGTFASRPLRRLRTAILFEQAAMVATTTHLIGLLVARGASLAGAGTVLGMMGIGKVAGRLLLLGPFARQWTLAQLAAGCSLVQCIALTVPLITTALSPLVVAAAVVGAASGATTVLRPLLVVDLVGPGPFAAVSGRIQQRTTFPRAGAPFAIGLGAVWVGWSITWIVALSTFALAAERYIRLTPNDAGT